MNFHGVVNIMKQNIIFTLAFCFILKGTKKNALMGQSIISFVKIQKAAQETALYLKLIQNMSCLYVRHLSMSIQLMIIKGFLRLPKHIS